jgi:hypothetical protein
MNYNVATRNRIGDMNRGLLVETSVFANATYLKRTQTEIFTIKGRIMLLQLFIEGITDSGTGATLMTFNCTFTTPTIAVTALSLVTTSIASLPRGWRALWKGGAVGGSVIGLTVATGGCSDLICTSPMILGGAGFVGTIGMLGTIADQASGTSIVAAAYVPMEDGASLVAAL